MAAGVFASAAGSAAYVSASLKKSRNLTFDARHELAELADHAAPADARVHRVPACAQPAVLRLEVEVAVEIERGAILVELGTDPAAARENEVDMLRAREQGAADAPDSDAFGPGALDPLTKEMVYLAVSVTNGCGYCTASHTAAARKAGMTDAMFGELMAVVGMANETNRLANGYRVPVDEAFQK